MLARALDYTYRDIETETQYKHTNCLSVHRELRAVTYRGLSGIVMTSAAVTNAAGDPWPVF